MSTEPTVDAGTETQNTVPAEVEPGLTSPGTAEETDSEQAAEGLTPEQQAEKAELKTQRRMDRLIAKRTAAEVENARLQAEVAELRRVQQSGTQETKQVPDVETLANYKVAVREYSKVAEQIVTQGTKAHADFTKVVTVDLVNEIGPLVLQNGLPSPFMAVVLEATDDPKALLYHLGKNTELAEELADLTPIKLARRLDRIERELADKSKPKPGTAAKPIESVKPSASPSGEPSDNDSVESWMAKERKRMAAKGLNSYG